MARNGISDIYLSYMVVSESKLDRLAALSELIDSVDCPGNIEPLQDARAHNGVTIETIVESENLDFAGIMAYEGHINVEAESEADYERL